MSNTQDMWACAGKAQRGQQAACGRVRHVGHPLGGSSRDDDKGHWAGGALKTNHMDRHLGKRPAIGRLQRSPHLASA